MNDEELQALSRKSHEEIERALQDKSVKELLNALDSKSIRIGDTAAYLLKRRKEQSQVADALLHNNLKRAKGRVRGTNILCQQGVARPENVKIFEHLLSDRSADVVDCALFGLVFFRSRRSLERINQVYDRLPAGDRRSEWFAKAIQAIERDDPSIYSPGFTDVAGVWKASSSNKQ